MKQAKQRQRYPLPIAWGALPIPARLHWKNPVFNLAQYLTAQGCQVDAASVVAAAEMANERIKAEARTRLTRRIRRGDPLSGSSMQSRMW